MAKCYQLYTDGACSGNRRGAGCGGYSYIIIDPESSGSYERSTFEGHPALSINGQILIYGFNSVKNTTNNRMEMTAIINGLKCLLELVGEEKCDVVVVSDSKYVIDNYRDYLQTWKKNGWFTTSGRSVLNSDLWRDIDCYANMFHQFSFKWVKGHSDNLANQIVDELAVLASKGKI